MKKYFLLATVAGCLLSANAMAGSVSKGVATIGVKAQLEWVSELKVTDIDFGKFYVNNLLATDAADIAKFEGGKLTILHDGVKAHTGETAGMIRDSSSSSDVFPTSITFGAESFPLKCDGDKVFGEVNNLSVTEVETDASYPHYRYWINATLHKNNDRTCVGKEITGEITATLIY